MIQTLTLNKVNINDDTISGFTIVDLAESPVGIEIQTNIISKDMY